MFLVPPGGPNRQPLGSDTVLSYYNYGSIHLFRGVLLRPMASITTRPPDDQGLAKVSRETIVLSLPGVLATVRIEPPRGWLELHLHEVWQYRELLYFFVWRDVKIRYKQTVIGIAWVVLQPLLTMAAFTLFFGRLARLPSDGLPYPVFYFAALVPWTYFSTALQSCTSVVVDNQRVITKVYFPRLVLPLSAVLSGLVDFAISFVVLLVVIAVYGIRPTLAALWLPVLLLLAVLTALGVGLWMSALNALYRDVRYVIPFVIQFWMFASPVAYASSLVPQRWRWLYGLNPMAGVIDGFRWALTGHGVAPGPLMLASASAVMVVLLGGLFFFQHMEGTVADRV
jgi:lipopolysaccharide transport system permease protein